MQSSTTGRNGGGHSHNLFCFLWSRDLIKRVKGGQARMRSPVGLPDPQAALPTRAGGEGWLRRLSRCRLRVKSTTAAPKASWPRHATRLAIAGARRFYTGTGMEVQATRVAGTITELRPAWRGGDQSVSTEGKQSSPLSGIQMATGVLTSRGAAA